LNPTPKHPVQTPTPISKQSSTPVASTAFTHSRRGFSAELQRLLSFTVGCTLLGFISGYMGWTLLAGSGSYIGWMLWQMRRLDLWLQTPHRQPPDASGIWGEIFDNIYRLQKKQRQEKRKLKHVINRVQETTSALRDGVVLIDQHGNIDWWNRAAEHLLGFQESDQGHTLINFLRHPQFVNYFEGDDYQDTLELPSPRLQTKRLQYQLTHFGRGERLLIVRDTTQIHKLESMRRDFVANVSHELRTPLTVIQGYLETLSDSDELPDNWQKPFAQMLGQSGRMAQLLEDLITLSKLETDSTDSPQRSVMLKPLLNTIIADARVLSGEQCHNILLDGSADIAITGSEPELYSAFSNLIFNAIKYSPAKSTVKIQLTTDERGVHFQVEDNGPGLDAKHIPRLTERFYRIDAHRNSNTGGTGLGLAIVKHALLRHDAELKITSTPGLGSCFSTHFPSSRLV